MTPLVSKATVIELLRVLEYPKFQLTPNEQAELLGEYLPYAESVQIPHPSPPAPNCRDPDDLKFLELAVATEADWLATGDSVLLDFAPEAGFRILTPEDARQSLSSSLP